jgi:hypothetical protein
LEQIPEEERGETSHLLLTSNIQSDVEAETPENVSSSVLGVQWDVKKDELHFVGHTSIPLPAAPCTKRELVSAAFKFYDPMGYLAPFLVRSKVLVQRFQVGDYDWNRLVPEDVGHEWNRWISEVPASAISYYAAAFASSVQKCNRKCSSSSATRATWRSAWLFTYEDFLRQRSMLNLIWSWPSQK